MSFIKDKSELDSIKLSVGGRLMRARILGKSEQMSYKQTLKNVKHFVLSDNAPIVKKQKSDGLSFN